MSASKQVVLGIFIGTLIGAAVFYAFTQFSQIANLQSQINQLQNENSQLTANITALLFQIQQLEGPPVPKYEKVQFVSAYAMNDSSISLIIKSTGTATATLDTSRILINGIPNGVWTSVPNGTTYTMHPGDWLYGNVTFPAIPSDTSVELMLQTTSGSQFPKVVVLP